MKALAPGLLTILHTAAGGHVFCAAQLQLTLHVHRAYMTQVCVCLCYLPIFEST